MQQLHSLYIGSALLYSQNVISNNSINVIFANKYVKRETILVTLFVASIKNNSHILQRLASVRPSVCPVGILTTRGSMRRGQHTLPPDDKEDRHIS